MAKIYSTAKIPSEEDPSKDAKLSIIMGNEKNISKLEFYWNEWREVTGVKMRNLYGEYIDFKNEAAKINGFKDAAEMLTRDYESETFIEEVDQTWEGIKPLYQEIHAYVRHKLFLH